MKTGGAAFPRPYSQHDDRQHNLDAYAQQDGMTLRDYFAGRALAGYIASYSGPDVASPPAESAAAKAYEYADAMIKAREGA